MKIYSIKLTCFKYDSLSIPDWCYLTFLYSFLYKVYKLNVLGIFHKYLKLIV